MPTTKATTLVSGDSVAAVLCDHVIAGLCDHVIAGLCDHTSDALETRTYKWQLFDQTIGSRSPTALRSWVLYLLWIEPRRRFDLQVFVFTLNLLCGAYKRNKWLTIKFHNKFSSHTHFFPCKCLVPSHSDKLSKTDNYWDCSSPVLRCVTSLLGPLVIVYIMRRPPRIVRTVLNSVRFHCSVCKFQVRPFTSWTRRQTLISH